MRNSNQHKKAYAGREREFIVNTNVVIYCFIIKIFFIIQSFNFPCISIFRPRTKNLSSSSSICSLDFLRDNKKKIFYTEKKNLWWLETVVIVIIFNFFLQMQHDFSYVQIFFTIKGILVIWRAVMSVILRVLVLKNRCEIFFSSLSLDSLEVMDEEEEDML